MAPLAMMDQDSWEDMATCNRGEIYRNNVFGLPIQQQRLLNRPWGLTMAHWSAGRKRRALMQYIQGLVDAEGSIVISAAVSNISGLLLQRGG